MCWQTHWFMGKSDGEKVTASRILLGETTEGQFVKLQNTISQHLRMTFLYQYFRCFFVRKWDETYVSTGNQINALSSGSGLIVARGACLCSNDPENRLELAPGRVTFGGPVSWGDSRQTMTHVALAPPSDYPGEGWIPTHGDQSWQSRCQTIWSFVGVSSRVPMFQSPV